MELTTHEVYESLTKEQLVELAKLYGRLGLTLGSLWFLEMEKATDPDRATKSDVEVWRRQGGLEAQYLKSFLGKDTVTDVQDVGKAFLLSPVWGNLGGKVALEGNRCRMSVTDCRPQKSRRRKGLPELSCRPVGEAFFEGFLTGLDPALRFRCVTCPPDAHAGGLWCSWEAWYEYP